MHGRGTNPHGSAPTACRHPERCAGKAPCVSSFSSGHRGASTHEYPLLGHPRGSTARRPTRSVLTGGCASIGPCDAGPAPPAPPPGVADRPAPIESTVRRQPSRHHRQERHPPRPSEPPNVPNRSLTRPPVFGSLRRDLAGPAPVLESPQRGVTAPFPRPRKLPATSR